MGIAQSFQAATLASNIKGLTGSVLKQFLSTFNNSTQAGNGFQAIEQSILSSVFETQKPYFEIAQIAIDTLVKIEDIIARISPLLGLAVNPTMGLAIKSRKPIGNSGSYGTPTALGYKNGQDIMSALDQFKTLSQKGNNVNLSSGGTASIIPATYSTIKSSSTDNIYTYVTISTVYSTGIFENFIDYKYEYINLPPDPQLTPITTTLSSPDARLQTLPEIIILGIFDSNGQPFNPTDNIQYYDIDSSGNIVISDSTFQKASWILQTDKWILNQSAAGTSASSYIWPTLTNELYEWGNNGSIITSQTSPGNGWTQLTYGDVIDFSKPANQYLLYEKNNYIVEFTTPTMDEYANYYNYLVNQSFNQNDITDPIEQAYIESQVTPLYSPSNLTTQLQNLVQYGKLKTMYSTGIEPADWAIYNTSQAPTGPTATFPDNLRIVFKPNDFNFGSSNNSVWLDPETDYDYKVIRVDSTTNINFVSGTVSVNSTITSFVKNILEINVIKNNVSLTFSISVSVNEEIPTITDNITNYTLDNWNFIDGSLNNSANYDFIIYQTPNSPFFSGNAASLLPSLFEENIVTFNTSGSYSIATTQISKFLATITIDGKQSIIDLSQITNPRLITDNKYSLGRYGLGYQGNNIIPDSPLQVGYLQRPQLTELDTESYFIIEAIRSDINATQAESSDTSGSNSSGDGSGWYHLPNAIGITSDLIGVILDITAKLIPAINELIDLLKNPSSFITDIISYNLGQFFTIFSSDTIAFIATLPSLSSQVKNGSISSSDMQSQVQNSSVSNYVSVDDSGDYKFLLDGSGVMNLFGSNFGLKLDFTDNKSIQLTTATASQQQALMQFVIGIVSMPLQIVEQIIQQLLSFFQNLMDPITMPSTVSQLLSFEWITQYFTPEYILNLVGIKFNPSVVAEWCLQVNKKNPNFGKPGESEYLIPDDTLIANLNDFISIGFENIFPTYTAAQFRDLCLKSFNLSLPILCFFEKLVNAFIMLIWSLMGISAVIPPPLVSFCNSVNNLVSPSQLASISTDQNVSGNLTSSNNGLGSLNSGDNSLQYLYEVRTTDGKVLAQNLNQQELDQFISSNTEYTYDFNIQ